MGTDAKDIKAHIGNFVATRVRQWMEEELAIELVPWNNDPIAHARQNERRLMLFRLETVIERASEEAAKIIGVEVPEEETP